MLALSTKTEAANIGGQDVELEGGEKLDELFGQSIVPSDPEVISQRNICQEESEQL